MVSPIDHSLPLSLTQILVLLDSVRTLDLSHIICLAQVLYTMTVSHFGNLDSVLHPPKTLVAAIVLSGCGESVVQVR